MPKRKPSASDESNKQTETAGPAPKKQSRLAELLANAISKDTETLKELKELLNHTTPSKNDGTGMSLNSHGSSVNSSQQSLPADAADTVSDVQSDLGSTCELQNEPSYVNVDLGAFSTVHPPIDKKLRTQILNREYVDLSRLLFTNDDVAETTTIKKTDTETITQVQKASTKKISSILPWCKAFQRYADIYCTKYPQESPEIFRYMSLIQTLSQHFTNWVIYDEKFRQLRATRAVPWGVIHTETYLYCSITKSSPFRPSQTSSKIPTYIRRRKGLTTDIDRVVNFAESVEATGGGGNGGEAYEWALRKAQQLDWSEDSAKALIMIGDELPHPPSYTDQNLFWKDEVDILAGMGVKVYGVQALNSSCSTPFYEELAARTGGVYLQLKDFNLITDMFLAVCYREADQSHLDAFVEEVEKEGRMTENTKLFLEKLEEDKPCSPSVAQRDERYIAQEWWDPSLRKENNRPQYKYDQENDSWLPNNSRYSYAPPVTTTGSTSARSSISLSTSTSTSRKTSKLRRLLRSLFRRD